MVATESPDSRLAMRDVAFAVGCIVISIAMVIASAFVDRHGWNRRLDWSPDKVVPLGNINLSDLFWLNLFGIVFETGGGLANILIRELPGILLIFTLVFAPILLAWTVFKRLYRRLGTVWMLLGVGVFEFLVFVPMRLWAVHAGLKYIVYVPEYLFFI
jgi:hypothetical protein